MQIQQTLPECEPHSEAKAAPVDWLQATILSAQERTWLLPTPAEAPRPEPYSHQTFRRPIPASNTRGGSDSPTDYPPITSMQKARHLALGHPLAPLSDLPFMLRVGHSFGIFLVG